jgi:predicted transcriptional regulator
MDLKEARFKTGKSQFDLRLLTGIHQSRISCIERGYVKPRDDEKEKIESALMLRIDWDETGRRQFRALA